MNAGAIDIKSKFQELTLIPCVVQDSNEGKVLMLAYMNQEAYEKTRTTGKMWFWSRSRQALWHKGETSGNILELASIWWDCDEDAILAKVVPRGPTCHTGAESCFFNQDQAVSGLESTAEKVVKESINEEKVPKNRIKESEKTAGHLYTDEEKYNSKERLQCDIFTALDQVIDERWRAQPEGSYTVEMAKKGENAILKKLGEETVEVVMACQEKDEDHIVHEAADLIFHLVLAVKFFGIRPDLVLKQLETRFTPKGR